jgi:DNA invertase Pin-like site-specific DNA recombinase
MNGQQLGYTRVSSHTQNTERQLEGIDLDRIFEDKLSGKDSNRPALQELIAYSRMGDVVHVHCLDRLGRNLDDLRQLVLTFRKKGVSVHFHLENLIFSAESDNPITELMFNVMGAFAEFERALIRERQREGVQIAKAKGLYKGRKRKITPEVVAEIRGRVEAGDGKAALAREYRISRDTLYRHLRADNCFPIGERTEH